MRLDDRGQPVRRLTEADEQYYRNQRGPERGLIQNILYLMGMYLMYVRERYSHFFFLETNGLLVS